MHIFNLFRSRAHVKNDMGERIQSLRITVPALRVGVLDYSPEELVIKNAGLDGQTIHLYYPEKEVSAKKFLKTLETAPLIVGVGHGTTTNEKNKKIDGWVASARYDSTKNAAMIDGVVKGKDEVDYVNEYKGKDGFGASAFIDFVPRVESGVTPDGVSYNAIAEDLKVTHVAITENVRDPENKVQVRNTVVVNSIVTNADDENADGNYTSEEKNMDEKAIAAIVANTMKEVLAKNAEGEELDDMRKAIKDIQEALKTLMAGAKSETDERAEAGNEDEKGKEKKDGEEKEEEEGATLENAKPSQALIGVVGTALNIDFGKKTPSFKSLAGLLGIKDEDPYARIAAVNAKVAELGKATAKNTQTASTDTVEVF